MARRRSAAARRAPPGRRGGCRCRRRGRSRARRDRARGAARRRAWSSSRRRAASEPDGWRSCSARARWASRIIPLERAHWAVEQVGRAAPEQVGAAQNAWRKTAPIGEPPDVALAPNARTPKRWPVSWEWRNSMFWFTVHRLLFRWGRLQSHTSCARRLGAGSTLLCALLEGTGVAGRPEDLSTPVAQRAAARAAPSSSATSATREAPAWSAPTDLVAWTAATRSARPRAPARRPTGAPERS